MSEQLENHSALIWIVETLADSFVEQFGRPSAPLDEAINMEEHGPISIAFSMPAREYLIEHFSEIELYSFGTKLALVPIRHCYIVDRDANQNISWSLGAFFRDSEYPIGALWCTERPFETVAIGIGELFDEMRVLGGALSVFSSLLSFAGNDERFAGDLRLRSDLIVRLLRNLIRAARQGQADGPGSYSSAAEGQRGDVDPIHEANPTTEGDK